MKYLFILTTLLSCTNESRKVDVPRIKTDTTKQTTHELDTTLIDLQNLYSTAKDTSRLNKIMDRISKFPEVEGINQQIVRAERVHMAYHS